MWTLADPTNGKWFNSQVSCCWELYLNIYSGDGESEVGGTINWLTFTDHPLLVRQLNFSNKKNKSFKALSGCLDKSRISNVITLRIFNLFLNDLAVFIVESHQTDITKKTV